MHSYSQYKENRKLRLEKSINDFKANFTVPGIGLFFVNGMVFGAATLSYLFTFNPVWLVTPELVASLLGGSIGFVVGSVVTLKLVPAVVMRILRIQDWIVNGNVSFQYVDYCSKEIAASDTDKLQILAKTLLDLVNSGVLPDEVLSQTANLTSAQKGLFEHFLQTYRDYNAETLTLRLKQNKQISRLTALRAHEWLLAECALQMGAQLKDTSKNTLAESTLQSVGLGTITPPFGFISNPLGQVFPYFDYKQCQKHIAVSNEHAERAQLEPHLTLHCSDSPIAELLSLSVDEIKGLHGKITETHAKYQTLKPAELSARAQAYEALAKQEQSKEILHTNESLYCQSVKSNVEPWWTTLHKSAAGALFGSSQNTIESLPQKALTERLQALQSEHSKTRVASKKQSLGYEIARVKRILADKFDDASLSVSPSAAPGA